MNDSSQNLNAKVFRFFSRLLARDVRPLLFFPNNKTRKLLFQKLFGVASHFGGPKIVKKRIQTLGKTEK